MLNIHPKYYFDVFIHFCLLLVLFTLLHTYVLSLWDKKNIAFINVAGYILLLFIILFMGFRPVKLSNWFGDMVNYKTLFFKYANGEPVHTNKDILFNYFTKFCSSIMSASTYFFLCVIIYIYPMYKISKKLFKEYWYYSFLFFLVSYSFWSYGVNGMRNGMATSLFLWGVSYHRNKVIMGILFLIASLVHKTTLLPIFAFILTFYYNKPKTFFIAWLACIPLSLVLGSAFIVIFSSIGFGGGDDRLAGYLTTQAEAGTFASTGFRWDFLFHSVFPVFAGWYFVIKRKFKDEMYFKLLNTYLICNGFWILIINANYSNRFAYLSWFMMAIVIIYPMLKQNFFKNQHIMIGKIMVVYFSFTYFMAYFFFG